MTDHDLVAPFTSHRCRTTDLAHREVERFPVTARDLQVAKAHHPVKCATYDLVDTRRVGRVDTQGLVTVLVVRVVELGLLWDNLKRDEPVGPRSVARVDEPLYHGREKLRDDRDVGVRHMRHLVVLAKCPIEEKTHLGGRVERVPLGRALSTPHRQCVSLDARLAKVLDLLVDLVDVGHDLGAVNAIEKNGAVELKCLLDIESGRLHKHLGILPRQLVVRTRRRVQSAHRALMLLEARLPRTVHALAHTELLTRWCSTRCWSL